MILAHPHVAIICSLIFELCFAQVVGHYRFMICQVKATFKPVPRYAIVVPQYEKGTMTPFPSAMAKPGQRIELCAETDRNYQVANVKVFAGYEITGGGGTVHAPALMQDDNSPLWFLQQEIPVEKLGNTIYTFTLPMQFDNVLSPDYQENTEFRVTFDFVYDGPQVLYCEDNTTLYFVNPGDPMKVGDTWCGHTVTKVWGEGMLDTGWDIPGWYELHDQVTLVDFALDFAKARPKSCYAWFYQFDKAQFAYLKYLNTSEVTNMNSMFNGCNAITSLDVNTFDVSKVTNATSMFRGCSNLTTIYCDSTWEIETAPLMFLGSEKLLGAVAYNGSITDGTMATPPTPATSPASGTSVFPRLRVAQCLAINSRHSLTIAWHSLPRPSRDIHSTRSQ